MSGAVPQEITWFPRRYGARQDRRRQSPAALLKPATSMILPSRFDKRWLRRPIQNAEGLHFHRAFDGKTGRTSSRTTSVLAYPGLQYIGHPMTGTPLLLLLSNILGGGVVLQAVSKRQGAPAACATAYTLSLSSFAWTAGIIGRLHSRW